MRFCLLTFLTIGILCCGSKPHDVVSLWRKDAVSEAANGLTRGGLTGQAGDITVRESEFLYAEADGNVLDAKAFQALDASRRHLYMKKLLLRRLILQKGEQDGTFSEKESIAFLLPRLEQAMEDYYILKKSNQRVREEMVRTRLAAMQGADLGSRRPGLEAAAREVLAADAEKSRGRIFLEVLSGVRLEVREGTP